MLPEKKKRKREMWSKKWYLKRNISCNAFFRCVIPMCWFNNKEFLWVTHTVEHNYISPSSTVGMQLHVSALYVDHLQVVI